jgi:hypothetical protein
MTTGRRNKPTYNIYLSYSWTHNNFCSQLTSLLSRAENFHFNPYFIRKQDPVHQLPNERQLYEAIRNKMKHCNAVLMMCGVYSTYSKWLNKEIIVSKNELNKPLIAVQPFEASRTSSIVRQHADRIVNWDLTSIVSTIEELT